MKVKRSRKESHFTGLAYYLCLIAFIGSLIIGLRHINDIDSFGRTWGQLCLMEAMFCIVGTLSIDLIRNKEFKLKPEEFKPVKSNTFVKASIILIVILAIQLIFQLVFYTIESFEMALGIVFAGPCEEVFFRGFIISSFIALGQNDKKYKLFTFDKKDYEISIMEGFGIIISSLLFAVIHVNYYNNPGAILSVFVGGLALGFFYLMWDDLTAVIIGHFLLNVISVLLIFGPEMFLVKV